ncbi:hypothetical protein C8J56DRAFT_892453 [Mycena floridula]|nr:hypothetical protein C8J56DRAFT_892453 [Mycena floridula]
MTKVDPPGTKSHGMDKGRRTRKYSQNARASGLQRLTSILSAFAFAVTLVRQSNCANSSDKSIWQPWCHPLQCSGGPTVGGQDYLIWSHIVTINLNLGFLELDSIIHRACFFCGFLQWFQGLSGQYCRAAEAEDQATFVREPIVYHSNGCPRERRLTSAVESRPRGGGGAAVAAVKARLAKMGFDTAAIVVRLTMTDVHAPPAIE